MGDFVISPLPRLLTKELCAAGPLCSTGVAPFQRYYGPSRHRLVFDRFPGASGYAVYLAPSISRRDEDGFSSCLACPCHRAVPTTPPEGCASSDSLATHPVAFVRQALLHGPEQIADLPVPVAESPGAVRIGHPERSHLVEYLAPNSVFNSLPRQRSSPHLRPDDRLVTIDRVLHHASLGVA